MNFEDLEHLSISDAVALLQLCGSTATEDELRANIAAGAPVNGDGTVDVRRYCGWLLNSLAKND